MDQSSTDAVQQILESENSALDHVDADAAAVAETLKRIEPYWHPYRTYAKQRWWNREILELVSTEFRDRSIEYYRYALESGVVTINGKVAKPGTIVRNGDRIENMVHRHEPPVTSTPVKILVHDEEREIIVIDKPGSIPVHATGRYNKNSLTEILVTDFGFKKVHTVNRLDRLTSGCMIIGLTSRRANLLCKEFLDGLVKKEYIARCSGEFPEEEIVVEQPLLTVDRQMGLNIVHPDGKFAKTTFKRLFYDTQTHTSVLHCRPWTGRSHQIRVHLQYIGYPIANDPVYGDASIWGEQRGKGGVSLKPSLTAPADIYFPAGSHLENPHAAGAAEPNASVEQPQRTRLPREDGTDIGISSPVPLSDEAVGVITKLRNLKDQDEDYSRWRDVIFKAKVAEARNAQSNDRSEGLDARASRRAMEIEAENSVLNEPEPQPGNHHVNSTREEPISSAPPEPVAADDDGRYCKECFLPLHPDPQPDRLFIFLHAWRYTTKEWSFKTDMPFWAAKGYQWQHSPKGAGALPGEAFSPGSDPAKAFDEITPELSSLGKESVVGLDA